MNTAPIFEVTNLTLFGDKTLILDSINWRVEKGQHWVILGGNGSGKTCLLSTLCGYLMAGKGDINVLGQRYGESDWRELRTHIGLVSSSIRQQINDDGLALEIVISGKYAILNTWGGIKKDEKQVALELLQLLGISELSNRPWLYLSQGERQRVLIARALMAKPQLLIVDEPCAGLDPVARSGFLKLLENLACLKSSPNLVLVTHHIEEITPAFTHVLMLKKGAVLVSGEKQQVMTSKNMSETFDAKIRLKERSGVYSMVFD